MPEAHIVADHEQSEPFKIIDVFRTNESVIDQWTFVFNEVNPLNGYYTMLSTDSTGWGFSQFCEGIYDPNGENAHLGERPRYIGERLVPHVLGRMSDE